MTVAEIILWWVNQHKRGSCAACTTVRDMVEAYMEDGNADGLHTDSNGDGLEVDDCGCTYEDLMPCDEPSLSCEIQRNGQCNGPKQEGDRNE